MEEILRERIMKMKDMVFENLMASFLPFPMDTKLFSSWTSSLSKNKKTVIYTSYMYQISGILKKYEKLFPKIYRINMPKKLMGLSKYIIRPGDSELKRSFYIINNITNLLKKSNIDFGYLYENEPYSGAILLESGFLYEFKKYGEKLMNFFHENGIEELITIDPHTTNALKRLQELINFDIKVVNYIELVDFKGSGEFVIHDSCLYSRAMNMYTTVRKKINESGIKLDENYLVTSKEMGICCGGPLSLISDKDSEDISKMRAESLLSVNDNVLIMCPLCYENLSQHISNIKDLAEVIS